MTESTSKGEPNKPKDTKLLYLSDTYKFEAESILVCSGSDTKGTFVVLDETIFYPQGGGQPSDVGIIEVDNRTLNVHFVSFNNGIVQHYVKESVENLNYASPCKMKIDSDRRLKNAKSHTGGHLLAGIVEKIAPELVGVKGHHFPEGPYVEFKGKLSSFTTNEFIDKVTELIKENIDANRIVSAREIDQLELRNLRNTEYQLQEGKKARVVQIDDFEPVPCGGTHLKNLGELKNFNIRKIQFPKENTKIGYICG
ncbi:hydrolase [Brachionus plicatilis]|uniref:Hydrolase n=1 Tax=Brachionus plicatilis TaxID=10195 RepID=A0A3M7SC76_BRAPC|nr:hydrolase [Brachionus plicatilis]